MIKATKLMLVDCDEVLLNWRQPFLAWCHEKGHLDRYVHADKIDTYTFEKVFKDVDRHKIVPLIFQFNESSRIGFLEPLRDAVKYIKTLRYEHGYEFDVITSISNDPYSQRARQRNLQDVFGMGIFRRITCLETGADKHQALLEYKDSGLFFVEDKPENALQGKALGLRPILVEHPYNGHKDWSIPTAHSWKEIYQMVI